MSAQNFLYDNAFNIRVNSIRLNKLEVSPGADRLWIKKSDGQLYFGDTVISVEHMCPPCPDPDPCPPCPDPDPCPDPVPEYLSDQFDLAVGSVTEAVPVPTTTARLGSNLGCTISQVAEGSQLAFPPTVDTGVFMVTYFVGGLPATNIWSPEYAFYNCEPISGFNDQRPPYNQNQTSSPITNQSLVRVTGAEATLTFKNNGKFPASINKARLFVTQVNPDLHPPAMFVKRDYTPRRTGIVPVYPPGHCSDMWILDLPDSDSCSPTSSLSVCEGASESDGLA